MTHDEWQHAIVQLGQALGWRSMHTRRARGRYGWTTPTSEVGWPDLTLWNPRRGGSAAIEVKVKPDLPSDEQLEVLASLSSAGWLTAVAYPDDLEALKAMLGRERTPFPRYEGRTRGPAKQGKARR